MAAHRSADRRPSVAAAWIATSLGDHAPATLALDVGVGTTGLDWFDADRLDDPERIYLDVAHGG